MYVSVCFAGVVMSVVVRVCMVIDVIQYGWTALHVAAAKGHSETVTLLLQGGADVNIQDNVSTVP